MAIALTKPRKAHSADYCTVIINGDRDGKSYAGIIETCLRDLSKPVLIPIFAHYRYKYIADFFQSRRGVKRSRHG